MEINEQRYNDIAKLIHCDASPVGIDAKKTHILIIQLLQDIDARLKQVEKKLDIG